MRVGVHAGSDVIHKTFKQLWAAFMSGMAAAVPPTKLAHHPSKLVFLGCPGVGKGTYASMLSDRLDIPHIAMGDLVREELLKSTPDAQKLKSLVNQGKLVSDDIVLNLLSKRFLKASENGEDGFILDGFPRTQSQAEILDQLTKIDLVVNLKLREDVLILKCLGRRICSACGNNFNLADIDVQAENGHPRILMPAMLPPPACASKLTIREDDTEDVIRERLRIYAQECKPVEDYYKQQHKLLDFDVGGGIPETWPKLLQTLKLDTQDELKY
ncbi:hypothetical protein L7F22_030480 [Adiantum nelumboides]|nr:hypothetical protein [Adiantum nelumboides]